MDFAKTFRIFAVSNKEGERPHLMAQPKQSFFEILTIMATLNNNMSNVMNANNATTLHPTTKEELRAIIEQELKRQGKDADLNHIDVSGVTDMSHLFRDLYVRNIKIDKWDTSNVTNMSYMFFDANYFNGDLSAWDVSKVTDMSYMFCCATAFNQPLATWNVSNVTNMEGMFQHANHFNQPLDGWNTSNVTNKQNMFVGAMSFNKNQLKKCGTTNVFREYIISRRRKVS